MGLFDRFLSHPEPNDDDDDALIDYERRVALDLHLIGLRHLVGCFYMRVQDMEKDIRAAVARHTDKLREKRESLIILDDYGERDCSAWHREALRYLHRFASFDEHL